MLATDAMPWSFRRLGLLTMPPVSCAITSANVTSVASSMQMCLYSGADSGSFKAWLCPGYDSTSWLTVIADIQLTTLANTAHDCSIPPDILRTVA